MGDQEKPIWEGKIDGVRFRVMDSGYAQRIFGEAWVDVYSDEGWHDAIMRRALVDVFAERDRLHAENETLRAEQTNTRLAPPGNVEAFVAVIEAYVEKGDGGADEKDTLELIRIIREQASGYADRVRDLDELSGRLGDVQRDNMALRARLAKLETVAKRHLEFFSAEDDCDCAGCDISRELGGLLDDSAKGSGDGKTKA